MSTTKSPKLAVIGVDAAEFSFIKAHLATFPNFSRAIGNGVTRRLTSTSAMFNGSVWPTFYTAQAIRKTTASTIISSGIRSR
jgi:predicted AlkP superfamily phosphohydrolase/phosphomutase